MQRDRRAFVVRIVGGEDADLHVEPLVAIDHVVAALAGDEVAAVAAEDDVTVGEDGDAGAQESLQAVDESDALGVEIAAEEAARASLAAVGPISSAASFVPVRTSLKREPDRPSTDSNSSSAAFGGKCRSLVENDRERQIGIHAECVVLVGRPVEAGHAGHLAAA